MSNEKELPKEIHPVEYAGFFDFNEQGVYDTSVINADDYPNAKEIADEIARRYNNFKSLESENARLKEQIERFKNPVKDAPF